MNNPYYEHFKVSIENTQTLNIASKSSFEKALEQRGYKLSEFENGNELSHVDRPILHSSSLDTENIVGGRKRKLDSYELAPVEATPTKKLKTVGKGKTYFGKFSGKVGKSSEERFPALKYI